jgi:hypothetical protein
MRRGLFALSLAPLAPVAVVYACGDPSYVFDGRLFVEHRGCLGTTASVDVVEGEQPRRCPPACLAQPLADGGRAIYVSTMCPPYPFSFDASGSDPACPTALAALERDDTCLLDGGSANPRPPPEDASEDAGVE